MASQEEQTEPAGAGAPAIERSAPIPRVWQLLPPFRSYGGAAWLAPLPNEIRDATDNHQWPDRSPLRLLEDGREFGRPHSPHNAICSVGRGRYSFWNNNLFFSSSDGSDPNVNGRTYSAVFRRLPAELAAASAALDASDFPAAWEAPPDALRCAFLGMGNRGISLASLARSFAGVAISWICDRSVDRLAAACERIGGREPRRTTEIATAIADRQVDIVFVTLPDHLHRVAAEAAFAAGKHVFLEKPIATTATDARAILAAWQRSGRLLQIGYVLRDTPFYRTVRNTVRNGVLGQIRVINASEHLDVQHGASFMRRWHAHSANSGGLIVHKACHDLDMICWMLGAWPRAVASFGDRSTFARPAPALFCSQCPERAGCPYADSGLHESRSAAEWADPTKYGLDRCVFAPDNDIVDHQVVAFELDTGTRGTFTLSMQNPQRSERRITLIGDAGRLDGVFEDGSFTVRFADAERDPLAWSAQGADSGNHYGGDRRLMQRFLTMCAGRLPSETGTPDEIIGGLLFAIAAEQARRTGSVVRLPPSSNSGFREAVEPAR